MRLSAWRAEAPAQEAVSAKVSAVLDTLLAGLGTEPDPHAWISWGEDPTARYAVMVPTSIGLASVHVRVNVPGEGPRAAGKIVRWPKLQVGELSVDAQSTHRLANFQVDAQILNGRDEMADRIARFALLIIAATDGRPWPSLEDPGAGA